MNSKIVSSWTKNRVFTLLYIGEIKDEVRGTNTRLDLAYHQHEQQHRENMAKALTAEQQQCHQVFKTSSYEEQKNINPLKIEGTCRWALQSPEYIRWCENTYNLLWVSADPGCGKSVLARSIIDDYVRASTPAMAICYFFFKDNEEQNHLAAALCSVLHQLFSQQPHLLDHAIPHWRKNGEMLRQETEELWRIFVAAASAEASCKTICIFDALDECREVDQKRLIEMLDSFKTSSSKQDARLKFLITSRPYDHIQNRFQTIKDTFPHLHLRGEEENDQIHQEIDLVVKMRVKELAKTVLLPQDKQQQLELQLLQMEHRTYLWLHLAIDDIRCTFQDSPQPGAESIQTIPPSVGEAYEKILARVPDSQSENVRKALQMIVTARRPLTTAEMAMALGIAISPHSSTAAQARLDSAWFEKWIRRVCGLFVFINNSKVYLIHQTAREFLISKSSFTDVGRVYSWRLSDAEGQMALICVQYLMMDDLVSDDGRVCSRTQDFLVYSATYWPDHASKMDWASNQQAADQVHQLYTKDRSLFSLWFPVFEKAPMFQKALMPYHGGRPTMEALHLAAFIGHEPEVQTLLGVEKRDPNIPDDTGMFPVIWASMNGHKDVIQTFLEYGADVNVNAPFRGYANALYVACEKGQEDTVQLLLEHGADVNADGRNSRRPLYTASYRGHKKIVELLIEYGADINAESGGETALHGACWKGHDNIAELLIEHGADINAQPETITALHMACQQEHDKTVELLIEHGADVNAQSEFGTALQLACARHQEQDKTVKLLLDVGARLDVRDSAGRTPLSMAAINGQCAVAKALLSIEKASADMKDNWGRTPLGYAAWCGHDIVAKAILDDGALDPDQRDHYGSTPLSIAVRQGHVEVVKVLLDTEIVTCDSRDCFGRSVFWWAKRSGNTDIQKMLADYSQRRGIPIRDEYVDVRSTSNDLKSSQCEVCTLNLPRNGTYYQCEICYNGNFQICGECYELGGRCLQDGHDMILQFRRLGLQ